MYEAWKTKRSPTTNKRVERTVGTVGHHDVTQAIELSVMVLRMVRTGQHLGLVEVLSQMCDVETRL